MTEEGYRHEQSENQQCFRERAGTSYGPYSIQRDPVKQYASNCTESGCENLRSLLINCMTECCEDRLAVFEQMEAAQYVDQTKPAKVQEAFSNRKAGYDLAAAANVVMLRKVLMPRNRLFR